MNILVVDDNSLHLKMCRILLEKMKHSVDTVDSMGNLKKSLATIKEPGMVFVDFRLEPGVNGVDVLNLLKNENKWSKTKYIALTADIAEKGYLDGAGFDDVIFKPVTEALLAEIIRKHA